MMIDLMYLFYNKYSNLAFEINNRILGLPRCDVVFLIFDETAKIVRLQMLCSAK